MNAQTIDNSRLFALSAKGDHDAFRQIVELYQNLICALAFSACGNVAKSEDLTQETFLIAWQRLPELKDPGNLKAWLCGIVRNLARNYQRKRQPSQLDPDGLENTSWNAVDTGPAPDELAAAREEAAIVEKALQELPEHYREPLILFYREDQSIQHVADAMDLSTDAVRQRLSRGRNMLRDRVEAIIERSLQRTKPTSALTIAIMTALPCFATQAKAAVVASTAIKAAPAAAKPLWLWSVFGAAASPLISLATIIFFARMAERTAKSPRERQYLVRYTWTIGFVVIAASISISVLSFSDSFLMAHPVWFGVILGTTILLLLISVAVLSVRADRRLKQIRSEDRR
jgi:RNA polymerase sigma factor (sigma-70 family)